MFTWLYLVLALFPLTEALIYPGAMIRYLGISPVLFSLLSFFALLGLRLWKKPKQTQALSELGIYKLGPLLTIFALFLRIIELFNHPNFIYSYFHISPPQVGLLALHIIFISFSLAKWREFQKKSALNWLVFSLYSFHLLLIYWVNPAWFYKINEEDQLIENLTCLVFLLGALISFYNLKIIHRLKLRLKPKALLMIVIFGLGLLLFVIAGEEISWGQRIFNIPISENLSTTNTQQELNIHNNIYLFPFVYYGYFVANLYGLLSWIVYCYLNKRLRKLSRLWLSILTTRWYYVLFFLPNLIYVSLRFIYGNVVIDQWEEISEIYLALGILATVVHHYFEFKVFASSHSPTRRISGTNL